MLVALVLCLVVGITFAFASSTAIVTEVIPMAIRLLLTGSLPASGVVAALAISTTIVDVPPLHQQRARPRQRPGGGRTRFYRQVIKYTCASSRSAPSLPGRSWYCPARSDPPPQVAPRI